MEATGKKKSFSVFIDWILKRFPADDPDQLRRARTLTLCSFTVGLAWPTFAMQYAQFGTPPLHWGIILLVGVFVLLLPFLFKVLPSVRTASNLYSFFTWFTLGWVALYDGGIHNQALIVYPFVPVIAAVFSKKRFDIGFWTLVTCAVVMVFYMVESKMGIKIPRVVDPEQATQLLMMSHINSITCFTLVFYLYERARTKLYSELEDKNRVIVGQQRMLIHSAQMSALGEMAGGIAHEINNPLAIIRGSAGILAELVKGAENARVGKTINTIDNSIMRIRKITDSLLRFCSENPTDPIVSHPIQEILDDVRTFAAERFSTNKINFEVIDKSGNASIRCRPSEIVQVLLNLLSNALDAVLASRDENEGGSVRLEVGRNGRFLEVRVFDSGQPVPEENRQRIFHPFFTTKDIGSGTGLGLSVSLGIIQSHEGELRLNESGEDKYFLVRLPAL